MTEVSMRFMCDECAIEAKSTKVHKDSGERIGKCTECGTVGTVSMINFICGACASKRMSVAREQMRKGGPEHERRRIARLEGTETKEQESDQNGKTE